jgi:hypothetical protein
MTLKMEDGRGADEKDCLLGSDGAGNANLVRVNSSGELTIARLKGEAAGENFDTLNAMPIYDGGAQITTATTTVVEPGPCVLGGIHIFAAVASTITVYDNTAASGTVICTFPASAAVGYYPFNRLCATGLTIVTAGASNLRVDTRKSVPA